MIRNLNRRMSFVDLDSICSRLVWFGVLAILVLVFAFQRANGQQATLPSSISVQKGFQVELIHSATKAEGSWISMAFDDQGRLIVAKDSVGLLRLTLPKRPDQKIQVESIEKTLKHCRGLLYAHKSLYVSATDSKAIYRLQDKDNDDQFETKELLKTVDYAWRYGHGTNQILLGPDQQIYWVFGNDIAFVDGTDPNSPYRNPKNDWLVPNSYDGGQDNRVGHILRSDPEGKKWSVIAGGLRNQVDAAFNEDGELFTFDADMEWDVGTPWYRPIRVNHIVSGGEYGWRWGTGKWREFYVDSLPSTLDLGLGSPTGVLFGTQTNFPLRYRKSLFLADWQNGRILSADVIPEGASYRCNYEVFVEGGPLNVCDMVVGPDKNLYFITGGRGSQTGLYKVSFHKENYVELDKSKWQASAEVAQKSRKLRELRRSLEVFHTRKDSNSIETIWNSLGHSDRWIRFAARVALENQPIQSWQKRALKETDLATAIPAWLAMVRTKDSIDLAEFHRLIGSFDLRKLDRSQLVDLLRLITLAHVRLDGTVDAEPLLTKLEPLFPNQDAEVNFLLVELLVHLDSKSVIEKSLEVMGSLVSQEEQLRVAHLIIRKKNGWNDELRGEYLKWLIKAKSFRGGKFLTDELARMRKDIVAGLSAESLKGLATLTERFDAAESLADSLPTREFVKQWTNAELKMAIERDTAEHSSQDGKRSLLLGTCLNCHKYQSSGSNIGPDLSTVGARFDKLAILESIMEPSKNVDAKYGYTTYELISGKTVSGRQVHVTGNEIKIETSASAKELVTIKRSEIESSFPSKTSPMPSGLLDTMNEKEILDLIDFLSRSKGQ